MNPSLSTTSRRSSGFCAVAGATVVFVALTANAGAPAGRYTVESDVNGGTVFDNKTKLRWQQVPSSTPNSWSTTACANIRLAGGFGWRMPTYKELLTLVDYGQSTGARIDATFFPATPAAHFWSLSTSGAAANSAWYVDFGSGSAGTEPTQTADYVRCVRSLD